MANTTDIIGEQETLDKLVAHTLEDFEDDRITKVRDYAFYYNNGLKSVNLPNATSVRECAFSNCYNIESIKIPKVSDISFARLFDSCYKLKFLDTSIVNGLNSNCFESCYSLNNFDLSNIQFVTNSGLSNTGFGSIVLPNCTNLGNYTGRGTRTSTIDLSKNVTIKQNNFSDAHSLVHLILRSDTFCSLSTTSAFTNTPIANGIGWIYVPTDLVNTYKTATNWSTYADQIVSIDEYPKALDGETITDTWDEIFQAENNNTYKTKYNVGDTKYLVVGGTYVLMQIVAFDRDILSSDGTSTAKITWLSKSLSFMFPINFPNNLTGGWANCKCREFLNDTIYNQIPENVRNKILSVNKTYTPTIDVTDTATVSDKLWIPSEREIIGNRETSGVTYTDFFSDSSSRIKNTGLRESYHYDWWLRSIYNNSGFSFISTSGTNGYGSTTAVKGIVLGFCT